MVKRVVSVTAGMKMYVKHATQSNATFLDRRHVTWLSLTFQIVARL